MAHLLEEAPRDWPTITADALDVLAELERVAEVVERRPSRAASEVRAVAWQMQRLARLVAEVAQRQAGDTEDA
jgi:hypothetical protein